MLIQLYGMYEEFHCHYSHFIEIVLQKYNIWDINLNIYDIIYVSYFEMYQIESTACRMLKLIHTVDCCCTD